LLSGDSQLLLKDAQSRYQQMLVSVDLKEEHFDIEIYRAVIQ
jgi:hypothetical protein